MIIRVGFKTASRRISELCQNISAQQESKQIFPLSAPHFLRFLSLTEHLFNDSPMSHRQCEFILCLYVSVLVCRCHGVVEITDVDGLIN